MTTFEVQVTIENKPGLSDPEGDTILNDLVLKETKVKVKKVKTAKMLKFTVTERDKKTAKEKIKKMCNELRIYNPVVSDVSFKVLEI
ncbi:MAG: phosphoribosylformylglycinamidine synthase subunit PurS [Nitrosopumilaceae archaeon]|nr:phosphoribosylformylglycinamidine synthase subunit PurS [Nitrosopumilaceae archaeon]NIU02501.1 phosphoribosylformylglycinamidine synthase subunit PurS [Nitrosopumilaceae archaeon]NIU88962.1 phosphoribosylformylglycinamidine synthase subunit PurS [Nitrosopumilaceae archaeon]NIV67073.1 phosphoribosylformylglycinamidine synthase subunit PurS [Nitrosopumilaceae archaeon]NIX63102.1 phosphoribosylformylglycinamidine synthase subunit PurS [Nitrosopumilaceae archaeon]